MSRRVHPRSNRRWLAGPLRDVGERGTIQRVRRRLLIVGLVVSAAAAVGVVALAVARRNPGGSFAGGSTLGAIAELGAGWLVVATGLVFWLRRPGNRFAPLLVLAGLAWFLPEWSNPGADNPLVFTIGLVGFAASLPLLAHAALSYPSGRVRSVPARVVLVGAYAGTIGLLGLLSASVFDPIAEGCVQCPRNLLLVHGDGEAFESFNRWGVRAGLGWALALALLIAWQVARSVGPGLVVVAPVALAGAAFLGIAAWDFEHSLGRGLLSNDVFDVRLWRYQAAALAALAAGVAWGLYRARRARASVASLVVELGRSPTASGVRGALATALGDPDLEIAYRRADSEVYVDGSGQPVELRARPGRAITPLARDGQPVAALMHDEGLLRDPGLLEEMVSAARLAVENARFQAEVRAQLESLRTSRARIVEAADLERRRLERDLHDGAQQRLVGLSFALGMARSQLAAHADPDTAIRIEEAERELREALAELRELAHGIYPAALTDEGLAAAVEALAEKSPVEVDVDALPDERFRAPVEAAAYFLIAETVKRGSGTRVTVSAARRDGDLLVDLAGNGEIAEDLIDMQDRVGALNGRLEIQRSRDGFALRAEIPCG
jgi:signal transduction histidine kinase